MVFQKIEPKTPERIFWKFNKEGDFIVGQLAEIIREFGINKSVVYVLKTGLNDDSFVYVWDHTTLSERLNYAKIGDMIKIVYTGKKKKYYTFDVYIDDGKIQEPAPVVEFVEDVQSVESVQPAEELEPLQVKEDIVSREENQATL
jgi:hypothetical protein